MYWRWSDRAIDRTSCGWSIRASARQFLTGLPVKQSKSRWRRTAPGLALGALERAPGPRNASRIPRTRQIHISQAEGGDCGHDDPDYLDSHHTAGWWGWLLG